MNKSHITVIPGITSLALSTGVAVRNMLKNEYNAAAKNIEFGKVNHASYTDSSR